MNPGQNHELTGPRGAGLAYAFLPPWGWMYVITVAAGAGHFCRNPICAQLGSLEIRVIIEDVNILCIKGGTVND
jgi:hypothetical protein